MTAPSLKRAIALMTITSAMTPIIGVVSAPLLTHGLGVAGRGSLSVASAPNVLLAGVVTFGLPEALTYFCARSPQFTARALRWATAVTLGLCAVGIAVFAFLTPFLVGGETTLAPLVLIGSTLAAPLLLVSLLRGAAAGLQMWNSIAADKVIGALVRLAAIAVLFLSGHLTVLSALIATLASPLVGAVAYFPLMRVVRESVAPTGGTRETDLRAFFRYGAHTWFGAVAGILLSRINQLLFAPLSDVKQLGLYVVAVTISDVPLITAIAIRDALFGVNSRENDAKRFAQTTRTTTIVGLLGGAAVVASMPFWIAPVFGPGFEDAMPATAMLLLASVLNIPAFLAAAGLAAWGRPALRSIGLIATLLVNVMLFVLLVPPLGAFGAAVSATASAGVGAIIMVQAAARVLHVPSRDLIVARYSDIRALITALRGIVVRPATRVPRPRGAGGAPR